MHEEVLEPAAVVRRFPWQCATCGHHELWHLPAAGACTRGDCEPRCAAWGAS